MDSIKEAPNIQLIKNSAPYLQRPSRRAAILYKLLNLDHHHISCAYEKDDSQKNGHFIPGTMIPIKPESGLFKKDINPNMPIINNAWHISSEIRHYLNAKGINNPIIDILENSDF